VADTTKTLNEELREKFASREEDNHEKQKGTALKASIHE
jgi:hypothetical protein